MSTFAYTFDGPDTAVGSGVPAPSGLPALVAYSGSWRRLNNRAHSDTAHGSRPMLGLDPGGNGGFDLSARVSAGGGDALYARWVDVSNWLCARVRTYQVTSSYTYYVTEYEWAQNYAYDSVFDNDHGHTSYAWSPSSTTPPSFVDSYSHSHVAPDGTAFSHTMTKSGSPYKTGATRQAGPYTGYTTTTYYQVVLEKSVSGTVTALGAVSTNGGLAKLRMRGVGDQLAVYLNDSATAAITAADGAHLTATKHGVGRGPSELSGTALDDLYLDNLNSPPRAPSINVPAAVDITRDLVVDVPLNDPDVGDTAKESFLRVRTPSVSTAWTVHRRASSNTKVTVPADSIAAGQAEFQGASRDAQGLPVGDENLLWSASKFTQAGVPPAGLSFTDPAQGAQIPGSSYRFVFSVGTATVTATEWRVLGDTGGKPDESKVINPATLISDAAVRAFTATGLQNGTVVHAQVRGHDGALVGAWVTTTHEVVYTRPAEPGFVLTTSERPALIGVRTVNPAPNGSQPQVAENRIRVQVAGRPTSAKLLARVAPNGIWTWRRFASGIDYEYDIEAIAENGTTSRSGFSAIGLGVLPEIDEGDYVDVTYDPASYD